MGNVVVLWAVSSDGVEPEKYHNREHKKALFTEVIIDL